MTEQCQAFLPSDWIKTTRITLLGMRMSKNSCFWDFAQDVCALNIVLRGTSLHLNDSTLCNQLEAGLEPSLQAECSREGLCAVTTLKEWIERVKKIDERLNFEKKRYREIFAEESNLRASKRPALGSPRIPNAQNTGTSSNGNKTFVRLPKLTDAEKDLLRAYAGCFKCQRFNAGHGSNSPQCPGFPSGSGYKTITKHADANGQPGIKPSFNHSNKGKMVASLIETVDSEEEEVVAVFAPSSVLGNGTDSGESDNVSDTAPLKCKHLVWKCLVDGPSSEFPLKIPALINNGCHLVLIHPDIVSKLGLTVFKLPVPEPIDVAIKDSNQKKKMELENFVLLKATSLDQRWTSRRFRALITPNLCMPIIFGLLFLSHNNIITDHSLRSCIDKKTGYDLINPKIVLPPPKRLQPKEKRERIKAHKRDAIKELKTVCNIRRVLVDSRLEKVKTPDIVGAIRGRIEELALIETLKKEDSKLREEFKDLFEAIPHVNELPTDCLAEIQIKDPNLRVKGHSYPCPRKYRDAWQALIKQHLDAGRIQPSSSAHASSVFIDPKSDPTALPRWMNDYRQLKYSGGFSPTSTR